VTVALVDMAVSNVGSVANMLRRIGAEVVVTADPEQIAAADRVVLPGVGSFDGGARQLRSTGLDEALHQAVGRGVPLLGVCLGMQLLADASEEGVEPGLGLIAGQVRRLPVEVDGVRYPVPHMGWNIVSLTRPSTLALIAEEGRRYYFVHSYAFVCDEEADAVGATRYGTTFTSAVERQNVAGVQFHPEKSHRHGMALLAAWVGI
jgi:imidazole glycerol-phosphate synthase subunit HisH